MRWDCIGRYGGLAMFRHDQTKVGNCDAAIRIPERLYQVIEQRQADAGPVRRPARAPPIRCGVGAGYGLYSSNTSP